MRNQIFAASLGFMTQACAPQPHHAHESGLKQLVTQDFLCPAESDRQDKIKNRYGTSLQGGTSDHRTDVTAALALIPNEYLYWVMNYNRVPIALRQTGGSVRGATTSVGRAGEWSPESIWVGQMTGNFNPMNHEFGHATEHYINRTYPGFKSDLTNLFQRIFQNQEANLMRGYARSSQREFFAEVFDSYYCGEESRTYMAANMPETFAFAERYLIPPDSLDSGNSADTLAGTGPNNRSVDQDGDQVSDYYDRCPDTPPGTPVRLGQSNYGCAANQTPR